MRPVLLLLVASLLAMAGAGCNIVQGYQEAGDSLFPEQSTHLSAPGLRVVTGNYRELGLLGGSDLFLVARGADDDTGKLYAMRYANPVPCEIPGVVRFSATRERSREAPLLSYMNENVRRGTLRFADATCKTFSLTFDDALLPVAETKTSVVVWAGSDLWLATPETGSKELIADGVTDLTRSALGGHNVVHAHGRLTVFDAAWKPQGTFGNEVGPVLRAGSSVFYADTAGVHRIISSGDDTESFEDELLVEDACALGTQDETWIALRSPCVGGKVLVVHEPTGEVFTLPFDADPGRLRLAPAQGSAGRDPLTDPFWFFFIRSGDSEDSPDTLFVRTPSGDEHALGKNGTLQQLRWFESADETYGYALVDVAGETGRYLWWNAAGETRALAEQVMWRPDRLIVNYDGIAGDLAVASGDRLLVVAERVPWQAFEYQDATREWTVLFHDMNEGIGRLSVFPNGLDAFAFSPPDQPLVAPELSRVASDVVIFGTSSLQEVLSGVIYLTHFDPMTRTGRLIYRNLELRFTAAVNTGVSDYVVSHDEVLYNIPYGDDAGIWLVPGK